MATASAMIEPCMLPRLDAADDAAPGRDAYTQSLRLPDGFTKNPAPADGFGMDTIWHFAYALLLRTYVRTNDVAFGVIDSSKPEENEPECPATIQSVLRVRLDDGTTLLENLRTLSGGLGSLDSAPSPGDEAMGPQFNTAICVTRDECPGVLLPQALSLALAVQLADHSQKAKITLHFNTDGCNQWTAQNVVSTFERILTTIIPNMHTTLAEMDFISPRDAHQIRAWNAVVPPPARLTLNECFESVFRENADKEAVYTSDGSFTYGQLDELSTSLALHLMKVGVKPNIVVPICMDKSKWVTCVMAAVWKAGGAFTAMEPSNPDERLCAVIEELQAETIICDKAYAHRFEALDVHVISGPEDIAMDPQAKAAHSTAWRMSTVAPDDLAFVVFTSGSTGKPKGILNTHNRLTTEHQWYRENMGYSRDARILQFASYAYVPGTAETYRTLLHGATLCVPSELERTSDLVGFIERSRATRALMTPSLLQTLDPRDIPSIRDLIVSGEPVGRDFEGPWSKGRRFVQQYGSTEGGTWIKETTNSVSRSKGLRPVCGDHWLVDPDDPNRLVPIGATGEIVLESHETAEGYLHDPEKTAHAFLDRPAWAGRRNASSGCRYLRLGDLGRYENDGSITLYGRADTQVKIHGQRVELMDIESHLRTLLPIGSEAIVDLVKPFNAPDRPLLTAFCRMAQAWRNDGRNSSENQQAKLLSLQDELAQVLPWHMIPKIFLLLEELPRNFSHKTDRKKLRTDAESMSYAQLVANAPVAMAKDDEDLATEAEHIVARSWATILRQEPSIIKRKDSFFALGGDSLAAIRIVPILRAQGLSLTTADILGNPALKDMAELAIPIPTLDIVDDFETTIARLPMDTPVVMQATDAQEWAALVGAQNGGWIDHLIYDFTGSLDIDRLRDSCMQLVAAHHVLRTTFSLRERVFMRISPEANAAFDVHPVSSDEVEIASQRICAKDRVRPLGAQIVRFDLIAASATSHRLIIRLSHAHYDAFTANSIDEHLRLLYLSQPLPRTLPFPEYLRKTRTEAFLNQSEAFWQHTLRGSQMPQLIKRAKVELPREHSLDGETRRLMEVPSLQKHGINTAALVKTAWAVVISALAQDTDVVFGDMISGRQVPIPGVETVFGPCFNFIPVRVQLDSTRTNGELLRQVQEHLIDAIPHESLGMRHIIEQCAEWGPRLRFSSIVNFINNVEKKPDCMNWTDGDGQEHLTVTRSYEEQQHDKTDLWLLCLQRGRRPGSSSSAASSLDFFFRYSSKVYSHDAIDRIAEIYCDVLLTLTSALKETVRVPSLSVEERELLNPVLDT